MQEWHPVWSTHCTPQSLPGARLPSPEIPTSLQAPWGGLSGLHIAWSPQPCTPPAHLAPELPVFQANLVPLLPRDQTVSLLGAVSPF